MELTINQRIMQVVEYSKLNKFQFAQRAGMSTTPLYMVENNDGLPNFTTISKILAAFPNISAEWLLRGEGEMILKAPAANLEAIVEELTFKNDALKEENKRLHNIVEQLALSLSK